MKSMNKNSKKIRLALASVMVASVMTVAIQPVSAATAGEMQSKGSITFIQNTDPTDPVDPIDPNNPVTPDDPNDHEPGTNGPLSIDYVSNLQFGDQKISGKDSVYYAKLDKLTDSKGNQVERPNWVQVSDMRGNNAGWSLNVTQEAQFKNDTAELEGAVMVLNNGTLASADGGNAPTAKQAITLTPGVASNVVDAKESQGTGTWVNRFGADNAEGENSISLSIPGKSKKINGKYSTTLTWTLTDSPV